MGKAMKNVSKKRWAIMHYGGVTMKGQHMKVKCNMTKMKNDTNPEVKAHLEQVRRMVKEYRESIRSNKNIFTTHTHVYSLSLSLSLSLSIHTHTHTHTHKERERERERVCTKSAPRI